MYRKLLWAAAAVAALVPIAAQAGTMAFSFETDDATFSVSGTVTVSNNLNSAGGYDVTAIKGTVTETGLSSDTITGLLANPTQPSWYTNGSWIYDNVVFSTGAWVDNNGLLFTAGLYDYNFYSSGPIYYLSSFNPDANYNPGKVVDRISVAAIPEPATWLMMALGFVVLGAGGRRASRGDREAFA